jgi:retron-type reverse transcriptase
VDRRLRKWVASSAIFTHHPQRKLHEVHYARCVAALEGKIVQRAVVTVLNTIYEEDFLGISYGFRPRRGAHDAMDALCVGIHSKKVSFILDADIRSFLDRASYCPPAYEGCSKRSG